MNVPLYNRDKYYRIMDRTQSNYANQLKRISKDAKRSDFILIYYSMALIVYALSAEFYPGLFDSTWTSYSSIILSTIVLIYSIVNSKAGYPERISKIQTALVEQKTSDIIDTESLGESENKFKVKDYFDYSFVSEFGKWIKLFLEDCKYPNLTSLIFDKATMDIVLNGKKKSANGKGYNAYLNSAVAIVLSRYMQKHAHYAPGLILLDSPILSLKEIDTQKPSQSMRNGLFENIASTSEGIQTIVIENEIPEIDYSNVNLIHFTKNANTGRYGFLIDVMD